MYTYIYMYILKNIDSFDFFTPFELTHPAKGVFKKVWLGLFGSKSAWCRRPVWRRNGKSSKAHIWWFERTTGVFGPLSRWAAYAL